jgi:signal transduction histidine kinase
MAAAGQLAAVVAKEIGAPLTAIQVAADYLITRECTGSQRAAEGLEVILSQTRRIALLTQQLIHLAESGKPHVEPVDLNGVVAEVCDLLAKPLEDENVEVICELAPGRLLASSDPDHLRQILVSLFLNVRGTLSAWTGDRKICLDTGEQDGRLFIRIAHTGPGISESEANTVFYPFVRREQRARPSAGLGLPLVRHLLDELRGGVRCFPNRGGGAVFFVTLEKWKDA